MNNPIQTARNFASRLFTAFGAPVAADNNVMTAGPRGPMLLQDVWSSRSSRTLTER